MITKTDIIILRSVDFSESSQIITVMSREHGKIALIAKGSRKPKSRFAGMLQPGMLLDAVYYYKSTRDVQTLTEASYQQRFDQLMQDIDRMSISMSALELISQLVHDNEVNEPIFNFTRNFLAWLNVQDTISRKVFPYIQVRLAFLTGHELQLDDIEPDAGTGYLNIEAGLISENAVTSNAIKLTKNQLRFLIYTVTSRKSYILNQQLHKNELRHLIDYLDKYFRYHIEGIKPRRSDAIFDQILKD